MIRLIIQIIRAPTRNVTNAQFETFTLSGNRRRIRTRF